MVALAEALVTTTVAAVAEALGDIQAMVAQAATPAQVPLAQAVAVAAVALQIVVEAIREAGLEYWELDQTAPLEP